MNRDKTLDRLRGVAVLWVLVVHVLYWGGFFTNGYINLLRSFLLFEMPLFFYIIGATNSFSKVNSYFGFIIKRFQRILIPYWVFAVICAILSMLKCALEGYLDFIGAIKILVSWLLPINMQQTSVPYLNWAVWFVPVYLCIVLIIPLLNSMKRSKYKIGFAFLLLGLFVAICLLNLGWIQNVFFYALWTYIGLFYSDIKSAANNKKTRKYFWFAIAATVIMICLIYFADQSLDMQFNKFPPNITFMVFSVMTMAAILLIVPYLDRFFDWLEKCNFANKFFYLFSSRSMTIFLYQVFAFNLTIPLANILPGAGDGFAIIRSVICLVMTIPLCAVLAVFFGKIENIKLIPTKAVHKTSN